MSKKLYVMLVFGCLLFFMFPVSKIQNDPYTVEWDINNTDEIGGENTSVLGNPIVVETDRDFAVQFDGVDDGLIVDDNPLTNAVEFTVEVEFKPYSSTLDLNAEQRFIHFQESDEKRVLIELRLTENNHWFLDTFIKSGTSSKTLYAEDYPHPVGEWYHAELVYKDNQMTHYVNGVEELSGEVQYTPMQTGQTSIGVRLNQKFWYKGIIRKLKITHQALSPDEFMINQTNIKNVQNNPRNFELRQNIPNPFNPGTTINYCLSNTNDVDLTIYDILGCKVTTLVNERQKSGEYSVYWDATKNNPRILSSGIYYARLKSGSFSKSIKLLYIK